MRATLSRFVLVLLIGAAPTVASLSVARAQDAKAVAVTIERPWSRATPSGAKVGVGYATFTNAGDAPDRLVAATAEGAAKVSMHSMSMEGDVMRMRALPDGIVIPAKGSVALKPGGVHLMFEGLKHPLKKGEIIPGTLTFEKAGTLPVSFKVEGIGAADPHAGMKIE